MCLEEYISIISLKLGHRESLISRSKLQGDPEASLRVGVRVGGGQ